MSSRICTDEGLMIADLRLRRFECHLLRDRLQWQTFRRERIVSLPALFPNHSLAHLAFVFRALMM